MTNQEAVQRGEAAQVLVGLGGVVLDEAPQHVKVVEQEMRVDLGFEVAQLILRLGLPQLKQCFLRIEVVLTRQQYRQQAVAFGVGHAPSTIRVHDKSAAWPRSAL